MIAGPKLAIEGATRAACSQKPEIPMARRPLLTALLPFAFVLPATHLPAAPVDPASFQHLEWRNLGPFRGGRVLAVTGVPGEPEHFYFGSVNGGVWESRNAGRTWAPIFDEMPVGSIGAIAVAPSDKQVIYVGTGEADMRSDIAQGKGMFKSLDGGKSWSFAGLGDSQQIAGILIDGKDPQKVFVAALGHPYGPNEERGVFRSRDGGASWQKVLGEGPDVGAIDLAFEPGNEQVIYAALWQTRRTPWSIYPPSSGPGSGLYKSSDGGDTWTSIYGEGLPADPGRIGVAVAPSQPHRVYALVDALEGGLFRSDDGGAHWQKTSGDFRIWGRGWYFGGVTVEPRDADVVWVCNTNLYRSGDGGQSFVPIEGDATGDDYHELWIDPQEPQRRIAGIDQGASVSIDGGKTWSSWYNQPTGQFYHVITDSRFPYRVYGAQQDSGAASVPSRSDSGQGITMMEFREVTAGGEADNIAPDPLDSDIIFGGRVDKLDLRSGQTRSVDPTLAHPDYYRRTWTLPLVFSRRDPKVLYFANQRLFRTADGGEHWTPISPDLTREDPGTPQNLDAVTAANTLPIGPRRGVIYSVAPSRTKDHDLWVGTDDGLIWRSQDEGATWQDITPAELTPWSKVGGIEPSYFDADTAYVAIDRHRLDDFAPYLYRTRDGGKTWQRIDYGIPPGSFLNVVREDPIRRGLLYAGSELGVYVSFDAGGSWQSLQKKLPVTSVRDIDVHGADVVIATHGRGFWVLDDVAALRQASDVKATKLFEPNPALRIRQPDFTGTPIPKAEPTAINPPLGAVIDYYLEGEAEEVTLEILDGQNTLVRRYTSTNKVPTADPAKLRMAPQWFVPPSGLANGKGSHRFIWPLRYAAPAELAGDPFADGVWAPPGRYRLVLEANGKKSATTLEVRPDPRIELPASAYQEQFELAKKVEALQTRVEPMLAEAMPLLVALEARGQETKNQKLQAELAAAKKRAIEISGSLIVPGNPANGWWLTPKSTTSLRFLSNSLGALAAAVDGADAAPSPDARAAYAKLALLCDEALASWQSFRQKELAALDRKLLAAKLKPLGEK